MTEMSWLAVSVIVLALLVGMMIFVGLAAWATAMDAKEHRDG